MNLKILHPVELILPQNTLYLSNHPPLSRKSKQSFTNTILLEIHTHTHRSSKVPLLPRQPPHVPSSDEKVGAGGKKKDKGSTDDTTHLPTLEDMTGLELDQQLVVHTYNTALTTIHGMVGKSTQCTINAMSVCMYRYMHKFSL